MLFLEYSKCSTCKRAKNFLDSNGLSYIDRSVKEKNPTVKELTNWVNDYDIPIKKLFNTSGLKYRELNLKNTLNSMSDEEKIKILSSDGMLVKRPLLIANDKILIGFKEQEWKDYFKK